MRTTSILPALLLALAGTASRAQSESPVDIGLYEGDHGTIEVRITPHADFDGVLSSLVFTLKWDATTEATLDRPVQSDDAAASILVAISGGVHSEGTTNYQVYSGLGLQNLGSIGKMLPAEKQYTIATIHVNGQAEVELANDAWTNDLHHNGDFYVSLGGMDRTGAITKALALGGNPAFNVSVVPNPNNGHFTMGIELPDQKDVDIELVNVAGKTVFTQQLHGFSGNFRKEMDLTDLSSGVYYLKIHQADQVVIRKVLFQ